MALRSSSKNLRFDLLSETSSFEEDEFLSYNPNRNKKKKHKKKKTKPDSIPEDPITLSDSNGNVFLENRNIYNAGGATVVCTVSEVTECQTVYGNSGRELRQRNVINGGGQDEMMFSSPRVEEKRMEETVEEVVSPDTHWSDTNGTAVPSGKLETAESLDWNRLMAKDPNFLFSVETTPVRYFMDEMHKGHSLRSTTTHGSEKERDRVYDTIFRLPWRCELLIDVGFFVCFDSFLSLLTIMPTRILMSLWRLLTTRQFKKPSAAELSDIGCLLALVCCVALLERTDISLIYHMIRGQGTIKLYVVYNVLEIFDRLCQSFGGDVMQTLFNTAEGLANCSEENMRFWIWRFLADQALAIAFSNILNWAITLSTCIIAHNNALLALLVSNNFAEIKGNVFKRFSKDNIHNLVYADSIERFHIAAFLIVVLAQNIREAEGPWLESFVINALMVYLCEMLIDIIKHSFLAKFNDIRPIAYSEFLEELCSQTLQVQTEDKKQILTFIPLAPACMVIRVLTPVYAAHLPYSPQAWRFFWILLLSAMTYVMLTSLKVMIGMGLQKHASWYINRCRTRKGHFHTD
ncbi:hypothetical protein M5689_015007 [Euphorbia peplus]|nr:hypothetical protein M5689_015007 [Euphorbia peplus]